MRELNRGGQVYFVHNRVYNIQAIAERMQDVVPEATHRHRPRADARAMNSKNVMTSSSTEASTCCCRRRSSKAGWTSPTRTRSSSTRPTGTDSAEPAPIARPRRAVQESQRTAICLEAGNGHIRPAAAKRLQAIEEFSELGAGFTIAMRDLEIRGAGNMLGTEQSGHIAAVGYELVLPNVGNCRSPTQAPAAEDRPCTSISISARRSLICPTTTSPDRRQKIDFYRRMTRVESFDEINQLREELVDRFGPFASVDRLLALAEIKLEAAIWQIDTIFLQQRFLGFKYQEPQTNRTAR